MGMPASGNPIPYNIVNRELLRTQTQAIEWNDSEIRTLSAKTTAGSQISSSDLYDKYTGCIRVTSAYNESGQAYGWSGVYVGAGGVDAYWGFTETERFYVWECYWLAAPWNCIVISYSNKTNAQVTSKPGGMTIKNSNFVNIATYNTNVTWSDYNGKCRCVIGGVTTNPFPVGSVRWCYPG